MIRDEITELFTTMGVHAGQRVLSSLILLLVGMTIIHVLTGFLKKALNRSRLEKAAHNFLLSVCRIALYSLLLLSVAASLDVNITGVIALASTLTLSLSLSLQNILSNVMGGFTVLNTHPFRSGDFVEIGGLSGTVQEISMFYTKLATPDNKVVSIPNSSVVSAQVVNYTISGSRRLDINISASYEAPMDQVLQALLDSVKDAPILQEPAAPFSGVLSYGDSAIGYTLRCWVMTDDYWPVFFAANKRIKEIFDERGLEMTYPHLNVHFDAPKERN